MDLVQMADETRAIVERGSYRTPSGREVSIAAWVEEARASSRLYAPAELAALPVPVAGVPARVEVTAEKTGEALRRLVMRDRLENVGALNFASARHPGGGFLSGARAQEEDLCRCSALYACLVRNPAYYEANRRGRSLLYTDHLIFSPGVPFFRAEDGALLENPFRASILTCPAPNAGGIAGRDDESAARLDETLRRRARRVLLAAAHENVRVLVLGAWGCGAFRNDPERAAEAFAQALDGLPGAFDRVVFAVYDPRPGTPNRAAFERVFPCEIKSG